MRLKERRLRSSDLWYGISKSGTTENCAPKLLPKAIFLYLILDKVSLKSRNPVEVAKKAISGGVDIIQLRDKQSSAKDIIEYGMELKKVTDSTATLLIINDRVDICQAIDADGVHLGQDDIPLRKARRILGKDKVIGISCDTLKEAMEAKKGGADYIAIGPMFKSPTKPELKPKGSGLLKQIRKRIDIPIVAIGGINRGNIGKVLECGVDIVAVASAILKKKNIKNVSFNLKEAL